MVNKKRHRTRQTGKRLVILSLLLFIFQISALLSYADDIIDKRVRTLLAKMTLLEKIGQMTQVDTSYMQNPADVKKYFIGSLLSGGNTSPAEGNGPSDWVNYTSYYQSYALQTRLKIPILYGIDAVHGNARILGAVVFPHNAGMGATRDPGLVEKAARITALESASLGINWVFAPCVAVARDKRWGRTYESYSEDPELVALLGSAAVRGFQGSDNSDSSSVLACPKHYLADGGTFYGTGITGILDRGDARVKEDVLRSIFLKPYIEAIKAGAESIMVSYSSVNGEKMHGNKKWLTDVLKGELQFGGFLVSDWQAIEDLPGKYLDQVTESINAGIDMVMVPDKYELFIATVEKAVKEGKISPERIDDAAARILRVKYEMGLFDHPHGNIGAVREFGSKKHREIARQAVRESIVLLKNVNKALPLAKSIKHLVVLGPKADNIGAQCGGWTINWQGSLTSQQTGTTILKAVKNTVSKKTEVTYVTDLKDISSGKVKNIDAFLIVIGEKPYAEMLGDSTTPIPEYDDMDLIDQLQNKDIPTIVVILSGRPVVTSLFDEKCQALLAAWLPGTEGQGVADVLFGDYNPTGKLPFTWPKDDKFWNANTGDTKIDVLYPYGYGLSY